MQIFTRSLGIPLALALFTSAAIAGCGSPEQEPESTNAATSAAPATSSERGGQEEFGPYEVVENWPQPLPDGPDGVKHEGWTWGSVGAVYAETPVRIGIVKRGDLPLQHGDKSWTLYSKLNLKQVNAIGKYNGV